MVLLGNAEDREAALAEGCLDALFDPGELERRLHRLRHSAKPKITDHLGPAERRIDRRARRAVAGATGDRDMSSADACRRRVLEAQVIKVRKPLETEWTEVAPTAIRSKGVSDCNGLPDPTILLRSIAHTSDP